MMKRTFCKSCIPCVFILCTALLPFLLASCRSKDPMDPYRNMGVPKGFEKEARRNRMSMDYRKDPDRKNLSPMGRLFEREREGERKFRDVSKPMERNSFQIFPWREDERRSSRLHREIRKENNRSDYLYW